MRALPEPNAMRFALLTGCLLLTGLDLSTGLIEVTACGYLFVAFNQSRRITQDRWWLIPVFIVVIGISGLVHGPSTSSFLLRIMVSLSCVGSLLFVWSQRAAIANPINPSDVEPEEFSTIGLLEDSEFEHDDDVPSSLADESMTHPTESRPQSKTSIHGHDGQSMLSTCCSEDSESASVDDVNHRKKFDSVEDKIGNHPQVSNDLAAELKDSGAFPDSLIRRIQESTSQVASLPSQLTICAKQRLLSDFQVEAVRSGQAKSLRVNQYTVQSVIGRGSMGVVYRAFDRAHQRHVALKLFRHAKDHLPRIRREAKALELLNHPNVVIAFEVGMADQRHFIATELIEGQTLRDLTKSKGPFHPFWAIHLIYRIADGVALAHERGIFHRDIKPSNIMLTPLGDAKLLDLGISLPSELNREFDTVDLDDHVICGTVGFMSPEQAKGKVPIDQRADLFSIGATLYYLLTGRIFCDGDSFSSRLKNTRRGTNWRRVDVPEVPVPLRDCLLKMLAYDREDRHQGIPEMLIELKGSARKMGFIVDQSLLHILVVESLCEDEQSIARQLEASQNPSLRVAQVDSLSAAADAIWMHTESSPLPLIVLLDCQLAGCSEEELADKLKEWHDPQIHILGVVGEGGCPASIRANIDEYVQRDSIAENTFERAVFGLFGSLPPHQQLTAESAAGMQS